MKKLAQKELKKRAKAEKVLQELKESLDKQAISITKSTYYWSSPASPYGISPTDIDAKGRFEYHTPERDEQGTYYGYKVLNIHCNHPGCDMFQSPRYGATWVDGELRADRTPSERSMFGIHFTKSPNHPELRSYFNVYRNSVLVKCALSGTIVETEQGFRAEHAQIIGVIINGNWTSYQDYQERARSYPNPIAEYRTDEEEWYTYSRYTTQHKTDWYVNPFTDSNP